VLLYPVVVVLVVMLVVNLLNNRWREHWYLRTGVVGAAVLLGIGLVDHLTWTQLGLSPHTVVQGLLWAAGAVGAVLLVYLLGLALPFTRVFFLDERAGEQSGTDLLRNALVVVPFGTVLLEEVAFRGVLLAMVTEREGVVWGVALSSIAFGLWHILPSLVMHEANAGVGNLLGSGTRARVLAVVTSVVGTGAAGVLFCMLRIWSGSLLAPMGLHWALNGLGFVFTWGIYRRTRARSPFSATAGPDAV
jgi:membrane protease YdiL (CAAX protease family)